MVLSTKRLYWQGFLTLEFEAPLVDIDTFEGQTALVFDETAFYPESGGQLADVGVAYWNNDAGEAQEVAIVDAQEDENGRVLHLIGDMSGRVLPTKGTQIAISIDEKRRRLHSSLHTGQHMLSRALLECAKAPTISSRLGQSICTIDTPVASISDGDLTAALAMVDQVILEDRPVRALYPTADELSKMPLRRTPKVAESIRIIEIEGFDLSPCGGTHCDRTGQVGPIQVVARERYKGGTRISFHTGQRALDDYRRKHGIVQQAARLANSQVDALPEIVQRLQDEVVTQQRRANGFRKQLARFMAERLLRDAGNSAVITAKIDDCDLPLLRLVAGEITAQNAHAIAVVACRGEDGFHVIAQCGSKAEDGDAGKIVKRMANACGGRGGGRQDRAEGRLPADTPVVKLLNHEAERNQAS